VGQALQHAVHEAGVALVDIAHALHTGCTHSVSTPRSHGVVDSNVLLQVAGYSWGARVYTKGSGCLANTTQTVEHVHAAGFAAMGCCVQPLLCSGCVDASGSPAAVL
jgi:hypothetical protein